MVKDYIEWKTYQRRYTSEDIGKDISVRVELADIMDVLDCGDGPWTHGYNYGMQIRNKGGCSFKLDPNGVLTVTNKVYIQRKDNMVERI